MAAAAAVDLTQVLQGAQNPDRNVGSQAEQQLKQFETQNLSSYLLSLASEVANSAKPLETRQIAGVLFKNALSPPRNDDRVRAHQARHEHCSWGRSDPESDQACCRQL